MESLNYFCILLRYVYAHGYEHISSYIYLCFGTIFLHLVKDSQFLQHISSYIHFYGGELNLRQNKQSMPDHVRFSKGNVQRSTGKKNKTLITKRDMNQPTLNWSSCSERGIILSLIFFESKQRNPKTRENHGATKFPL